MVRAKVRREGRRGKRTEENETEPLALFMLQRVLPPFVLLRSTASQGVIAVTWPYSLLIIMLCLKLKLHTKAKAWKLNPLDGASYGIVSARNHKVSRLSRIR